MKAPFVWFGGKRKVAGQVWAALGDVDNYVEPFAGSLAVLLGRPDRADGSKMTETVNDADGFLANFWRAVAADPEAVAYWADYPVNEVDLFARHLWLVNSGRSRLLEGMEADPLFFDAQVAGWWVWGVNSWIGSGWCAGTGPWQVLDDGTVGKLPHLGDGRGVNRKLPHLGAGRGVTGFWRQDVRAQGLVNYFGELADRFRDVRVCCGDWTRVVTPGALSFGTTVGVFLDPPYLGDVRTADLYAVDDHTIAHDCRKWALENGDNKRMRIILAGYTAEHDHLIPDTWRRITWSASASYQTSASALRASEGDTTGNLGNRTNECLWLSPHCLDTDRQLDLFGEPA
jgi:DNA adenine methylase